MKRNILRAAVAASILGVNSVAFAADTMVEFGATIENQCSITADANGTLGIATAINQDNMLSSKPTESTDGTLAQVTINCAGSGTLSMSQPVPNSADATAFAAGGSYNTGTEVYADVNGSSNLGISNTASGTITPNGTPTVYYIHMYARDSSVTIIPDGIYTYMVTVSIVPN